MSNMQRFSILDSQLPIHGYESALPSSFFTTKAPIATISTLSKSTESHLLPSTFHQGEFVSTTLSSLTHSSLYESADMPPTSSLRTVYLGNLPPIVTYEEICDVIKGGIIENIKIVEEKNCAFVTFLDPEIASYFIQEVSTRPLIIQGREIKVGWGKNTLISETLWQAVKNGASRHVLLANVENLTIQWLDSTFSVFGNIEQIKIISEKNMASIHLTSITSAIKAVVTLSMDTRWSHTRISYGRDRCAPVATSISMLTLPKHLTSSHIPNGSYLNRGVPQGLLYNQDLHDRGVVSNSSNISNSSSSSLMGNRTVYLGGIHPEATTKDLCDAIRGGILQNIKYMADKNIAFITFIEASAALSFYNRGMAEGLSLKGKRVKFGWGKPTPLPHTVASAVLHLGASRNVYIGSLDEDVTEEILRQDFAEFGEIELVNLVPEKNIGFVNFTDIMSAVKAVELMRQQMQQEGVIIVGNGDYTRFKINFGKDRCGNPPRPPRNTLPPPNLSGNDVFDRKLSPHICSSGSSPMTSFSGYSANSFYDSPTSSGSSSSLNNQIRRMTPPISPISPISFTAESPSSRHHSRIMSSLGLDEPDLDLDLHHLNIDY